MPSEDAAVHEVTRQMRDLLHALLRESLPAWIDLPLSLPQLRVLFIIAHHQAASVAQVAQALGIGEPTASHLVDKLARAGLLDRKEDPRDRRRARVSLSSSGEGLIEKLLGWEEVLGLWLQRVPAGDLAQLQHGLDAMLHAMPKPPANREA